MTDPVPAAQLAAEQDIQVRVVPRRTGTGWYVHDRRDGERTEVAVHPGVPVERHELDEIHTVALTERLLTPVAVLSGPAGPQVVDADLYRRLAEHRGAGDSTTAGVAAVLARGGDLDEAVRTGAAAGALNVTRHGLGTGRMEAVRELLGRVRIEELT